MKLNDSTFEIYAAQNYCNTICLSKEEFEEDLKRISLIKRILKRHIRGEQIPTRLLLNHIIIFYNTFEIPAATKLLEYKMQDCINCLAPLKTCLIYLNLLKPEFLQNVYPDIQMRNLIRKDVDSCQS